MVANAFYFRGVAKSRLDNVQDAIADYTAVIEMEGAPKEQVANCLFNRGLVKLQLNDTRGAIADCSAVIEMEGAPKEQFAKALFVRWLLKVKTDPTSAAFGDLLQVVSSGVTTNNLMSNAAVIAISAGRTNDIKAQTKTVLRNFSEALATLPKEQAREMALHFLNVLAGPSMKETWPNILRGLVVQLNPEVAEAVRFLEPVASVLEGKDRTLLDALPPEQREFALEVLAKFEPKPEPKPEKAQKANYGKRPRAKK